MALQNSIYAPTPIAVAKGGTGNTTPTFSSGPLILGSSSFRAPNGGQSSPSYTFTSDTDTGIFRGTVANQLNITCGGEQVALFGSGAVYIGSSGGFALGIEAGLSLGTISASGIPVINMDTDGFATIPQALTLSAGLTSALPIGSGGTGLTTTPTNGKLLIGNGTNYTSANITGGTNIGVTNGAGSITLNATGPASLTYSSVTSTPVSMSSFRGYINDIGSTATFNLPDGVSVAANTGDIYSIVGTSISSYSIHAQGTGGITYNNSTGTILTTASESASITIICRAGGTTPQFSVLSTNGEAFILT